jgi:hypothetical protein
MKNHAAAVALLLIGLLIIPVQCTQADGNQPPTVTIVSPQDGATVNGTIVIEGTANDTDGTVQTVEVKVGTNGTWLTANGTAAWTFLLNTTSLSNGACALYARSFDGDNYSAETRIDVTVNNIIIPITVSLNGTVGANGWYVSAVTVTLQAGGNASTIERINYSIDGVWHAHDSTVVNITLGDGAHIVRCYAVGTGGVHGGLITFQVNIDSLLPTVDPTLDPPAPNGAGDWYITPVDVFVVANGTGSPLAELYYKIDEGGWSVYGGQFTVTAQGNHTVTVRGEDEAGNIR